MAIINQIEKTDNNPIRIDYTSKDYTNILDDLIESIPGITQKWYTSDANDPGLILVKLMSIIGDMLFYNQDMMALEIYPSSVTQRKNAASIYKLIGYKMHWYKSATTIADIINTYSSSATLPRFCTFRTESGITYTTFTQEELEANMTNNGASKFVELVQGIPVTPVRVSNSPYPDVNESWHAIYGYNFTTDDVVNNRLYLKDKNVDQDHIILIDDSGEEWILRDNIYLTTAVGRFFEFGVDVNDQPYLELIDYYGNFNISKFKVFYIISDGENGEIGENTLKYLTGNVWSRYTQGSDSTIYNVGSFIHFTNTISTLGYNPETPNEARKNSVLYQNTLDTLITLSDFEKATLREPGVANVRATDLTNDPGTVASFKVGDINRDGYIDELDYELLQNHLASPTEYPLTTYQLRLADCNQDGVVNNADLLCMYNYLHPQSYRIGDVNQDGYTNRTDVDLITDFLNGNTDFTNFQKSLADINQDGEVTQDDVDLFNQYLSRGEVPPNIKLIDEPAAGYIGVKTINNVELLKGFVVKLYILRNEAAEEIDDDSFISMVKTDLQEYKILPLTIEVDLHSIQKYYWSIVGKFVTKEPLSRDELQTIMVNINTTLRRKYSIENINFNSTIDYRELIETILNVDNRILNVDIEPIEYKDEEGNVKTKADLTGNYTQIVPRVAIPSHYVGDVNLDGVVNADDITLLSRYVADPSSVEFTDYQVLLADFNRDGVVDSNDVTDLQAYWSNPLKPTLPKIEDPTVDTLHYNFTVDNVPILPGSLMIRVNDGQYILRDNNNGQIYNVDGILARKGKVDYLTGEIQLEFNNDLITDLIVGYVKNATNVATYKNLSTQTFYFDSSSLIKDETADLV